MEPVLDLLQTALLAVVLYFQFRPRPMRAMAKKKGHVHAWERRTEERTNKQLIGIYRCVTCGEHERRVEGPDDK